MSHNDEKLYTYSKIDINEKNMESIKEKTLKKIEKDRVKKKNKLIKTIAVASIGCIVFFKSTEINATLSTWFRGVTLITDDVSQILNQKEYGTLETEGEHIEKTVPPFINNSKIVSNELGNKLSLSSVSDLSLVLENGTYTTKDFVLNNADMAVIIYDEGIYLKKGEELNLRFDVDLSVPDASKEGEYIEIGYIYNDKYQKVIFDRFQSATISIKADSDGYYYPTIINCALWYTSILNLTINK